MVNESDTIIIREVWSSNLKKEFDIINSKVKEGYRYASFDTEFPGTVFPHTNGNHRLPPPHLYNNLKLNVDSTNIIQLGLTLTNEQRQSMVWEFNFRDFNLSRGDLHNSDSIQLLKQQGIDFEKNAIDGIDSSDFAASFLDSGLRFNPGRNKSVVWIGLHTGYDFGYLVRILTRAALPRQLGVFMAVVRSYFGPMIYDIKHMMKYCNGLHGGLESIAKLLGVDRRAGKCHQVGSDSLLTSETFFQMKDRFFEHMSGVELRRACGGTLFGLEVVLVPLQIVRLQIRAPVLMRAPVVYRLIGAPQFCAAY